MFVHNRLKTRIFEIDSTIEDFLENLLKCSSHLKRLVLDDQCGYNLVASANNPTYDIGDCLFNFVSKMELLAFSFTSVRVHPDVFKELSRRFIESIVPLRPPSFWFHLGSQPPNANDHLVPRIHSDEIVHHIDWFHASPKFDWYCPAGNLWASLIIRMMGLIFEIQNRFPEINISTDFTSWFLSVRMWSTKIAYLAKQIGKSFYLSYYSGIEEII